MKIPTYCKKLIPRYCAACLWIMCACSDGGEQNSQLNAEAGADLSVLVGKAVTLDGSGSTDSKGNPFEFSWKFIAKPGVSGAQLDDGNSETPKFTPDVQGKYKIELTISNTSSKGLDTVTVAVFDVIIVDGTYENLFPGPNVGIRDFATALGELYATCEFTEIGGIQAKKIARYNGTSWNTVGCGLEEGSAYDMIAYKGELYVTGQFNEIGCIQANNIARWNGTSWKTLEGGLTGGSDPFGQALAVYNDELYVGGEFTKAGDINVSNIAKWNGTGWSAVGIIGSGSVRELQVYKEKLYAGGFFTVVDGAAIRHIAAYNGSNWTALGSLSELELKRTGIVKQMAVYKEILYISGDFSQNNEDVSELITWNGSQFSDFGRAFTHFQGNEIRELTVVNGMLYIGGAFKNVVGSQANNILQWDGQRWGIMSEGILGTVNAIESFNNKMYIGGDFNNAGGSAADNISIWIKN
jgi:hypothetical protein